MNMPNLKLNDNKTIPQVGLGMWKVKDEAEAKQSVKFALKAGYTHFDTAQVYGNEAFLGVALKEAKIPRKDIFITTKIAVDNLMWDNLNESFEESLKNLQTDYVDLLLIHFPVTHLRKTAWVKLEEKYRAGQAKSIGVSNYTVRHLKQLLKTCNVKPAVNQVELHVFLQQPELVAFCKANDILIEAYSPLAHGYGLDDRVLQDIARKHHKSTAQIMLRWCVQQGFVILPKSTHEQRIKENIDVFDFSLDKSDLASIKKLDQNFHTCWDPTYVP